MKSFIYAISVSPVVIGFWQLTEASQDFWAGRKSKTVGHLAGSAAVFMLAPVIASSAEELSPPDQSKEGEKS